MYPKFIIVTKPGEFKGYLRMGYSWNHRDLRMGYEKIHGGGWWDRDDNNRKIVLYGQSIDFGEADFSYMDRIDSRFKDYTFYHTQEPYYSPGDKVEKIDTSHVEWV